MTSVKLPEVHESRSKLRVAILVPEHGDSAHNILLNYPAFSKVKPVSYPLDLNPKMLLSSYYTIACCEAFSNLRKFDGLNVFGQATRRNISESEFSHQQKQFIGSEAMKRITEGRRILVENPKLLEDAYDMREKLKSFFESVFKDADYLLTLTTTTEAPFIDEIELENERMTDILTIPFSLAGIPTLSLPVKHLNNLTDCNLSVQIAGPQHSDNQLAYDILTNSLKNSLFE